MPRSKRSSRGKAPCRAARRICWRRSARWTRWARSATASGTSPRCSTTRISATTRSTHAGSRSRSCSRVSSRPAPGSTPSCSRSRSRRFARGSMRMTSSGVYRFAIESLFHEQEHVLDEQGERLMSFAGRFNSVPHDSYAALTTADMKFPALTLAGGERVTLSYGQYRALLETNRRQEDRAAAYRAFHRSFADNQNTYAALYNGVLQRDWFHARARGYPTTLDAALHGNNIPTSVVENLITATKDGRRAAQALSPPAAPRAGCRHLPPVRLLAAAGAARRAVRVRRGRGLDRGFGGAARRRLSAAGPPCVRGELDRRLRERGQAERRVFRAGVRRASVHAAELQRDARCGVHAGARDGPLDAHAAVAPVAAVRLRGLHDFCRRGAVHAQRGAVPGPDARARAVSRGTRGAAAACHRQHCRHVLYAGVVRRFRAAGAPARRAGPAGDRGNPEPDVRAAAPASTTAT